MAGIFTRRTTGPGALVGFAASAGILFVVSNFTPVHFFLYAGIGVVSCAAIAWLVSFALPAKEKSIEDLTIYSMPPRH